MKSEISLVLRDGQVVTQMIRLPAAKEICIIDTLRCTFHELTLHRAAGETQVTDDQVASAMSMICRAIFGFGLTRKLPRGRDFFSEAWELGENYGHFALGGSRQQSKVLLALNGQGCLAANDGWEHRLHRFLTSAECVEPRITRVDLAHDDFTGLKVSPKWMERQWEIGGFDRYHNRPEPGQIGPWKSNDPTGKGLTFYAGTSKSSLKTYCYEKGKQLGSPSSPWCRLEQRWSNHDVIIPFDVLLNPSAYFLAAYPCLPAVLGDANKSGRMERIEKIVQGGAEHNCFHLRRMFGKSIRLLRQVHGDADFLDMVQAEDDELPKWARVPTLVDPSPTIEQSTRGLTMPQMLTFSQFISAAPSYGYRGDYSASAN